MERQKKIVHKEGGEQNPLETLWRSFSPWEHGYKPRKKETHEKIE